MSEDTKDKYCAECKYLVGRRTFTDNAETWRCHASSNVVSTSRDLVTGATLYHLRFESCYDARSDEETGCGSAGSWYEKYEPYSEPTYTGRPKVVGGMKMTAEALLAELEGEKKDG